MLTKATNYLSAAAAIGLLGASGGAFAAAQCPETGDPQADYRCVIINTGAGATKLWGDGVTGAFFELGLTGTLATSIYQAGLAAGSSVVDTNRKSVMNSFGITSGTFNNVLGAAPPQVNISDTASDVQKNIDALNSTVDNEGLNQGNPGLGANRGWQLTFDYVFTGTLGAGGPSFTGGDILFTYTDLATGAFETVLRVNVDGSNLSAANLDIFGKVSFDFDNNGSNDCLTALCQNFWSFQTGTPPQDWYTLNGDGVEISFALDTNVNPPFPVATSLTAGANPANPYWARQTTLDSSIRFINEVPEPGSLALVGVAMLGLAASAARRSRKA